MRTLVTTIATGAVVLLLAGCGDRDSRSTADEFTSAFNDRSLAQRTDLFKPAPDKSQLDALSQAGNTCQIDSESITILDSGITPQIKRFVAVARCGDENRLIGGTVSQDDGEPEPEGDWTIDPSFLPGGDHEGGFSTSDLPKDMADTPPLKGTPPK